VRVGGGKYQERLEFAKGLLGKEITFKEFAPEGAMIDIASITKGKGFQGHIKRWGCKLLSHKNSKHRRMIGNLGPKSPKYVRPSVPQAGQMGYHQRTEFNKRVLKIGDKPEEINPKGGFLHYGLVRNSYIMLHGSIPGPTKRLIGFRDAARLTGTKLGKAPEITYVSQESKQGA
jgi:large subunit ribosomal protein L3